MARKILVIEDDGDMAGIVQLHLEELGYDIETCADGELGLSLALQGNYDLVVLDLMLPRKNGLEICRSIRAKNAELPILMLTRKSDEVNKVLGFELGADDYLTKPFSILEFIARVKALLRRTESAPAPGAREDRIVLGDLEIDLVRRRVTAGGETPALTATEFELLAFLAEHPGRPFTRSQLLQAIWEYSTDAYENTVSTHVNRLRNKIEPDPKNPRYILTVWGVGYRFAERDELERAA